MSCASAYSFLFSFCFFLCLSFKSKTTANEIVDEVIEYVKNERVEKQKKNAKERGRQAIVIKTIQSQM